MRIVISVILALTTINLLAQVEIKIIDFTIIPLDVIIDKNNNYHHFEDLYNADYGIYVKLLMTFNEEDTLSTNNYVAQLIEYSSEEPTFIHCGNDIILFSNMDITDSPPQRIYLNPFKSDTVHLFMYGYFSNVLYEKTRRKFNCDDCNEILLRKTSIIEKWIRKKTKLRIFYGDKKRKDVKSSKVRLITDFEKRNYYLSLLKPIIQYHKYTY